MQALSDLVEFKKQELGNGLFNSKAITIHELDWEKAIKYTNELKADYKEILTDALEKGEYVKKFKLKNNTILQVIRERFGHEIQIEVAEDETKVVRKVTYFAFNKNLGIAYVRGIVG